MSNVKISALPLLSCVDVCNSVVPIVQCGVTYKTLSCNVAPPSSVIFTAGSGTCSSVRCGVSNTASGAYSFAGGGCSNTNGGLATSIVGGTNNTTAQYVSCTYNITNSNLYGMGYLQLASSYGDVTSLFPNGSTVTMNSATYGLMTGQVTVSNYYGWIPATVIATTCSSFYCDFTTITGSTGSSNSFIGGGQFNTVCSTSSNIVGGRGNTIHPAYSSIVGGCNNTICSVRSFIGGGLYNTIGEYSKTATITGGTGNCIAPNYNNSFSAYYTFIGGGTANFASNEYSTIVGGCGNSACGCQSFIGNGYQNVASGYGSAVVRGSGNQALGGESFIGNGGFNKACCSYSVVVNGLCNLSCLDYSFIGTGCCNIASSFSAVVTGCKNSNSSYASFIGSGTCNNICNSSLTPSYGAVVVGGVGNNTCGGTWCTTGYQCFAIAPTKTNAGCMSFIGGGFQNRASGDLATITGGECNTADGAASAVLGGRNNTASANYSGVFGCGLTNNVACSFMANRLRAANLATAGCAVCTDANGMLLPYTPAAGAPTLYIVGGGTCSTVRCGVNNIASGNYSAALVGRCNTASANCATVVGGLSNTACGVYSFVDGGIGNTASGYASSLIGGKGNVSSNTYSSVVTGMTSTSSGQYSVIINGICNRSLSVSTTVSGGYNNTASGYSSHIIGGMNNSATHFFSNIIGTGLASSATCTTYVGALSKTSGTFRINHPDPSKTATKYLQHSFVESPTRGDNIYRFSVCTSNCAASVVLPDYYKFLNEDDQVWVSPKNHFGSGYGIVDATQSCISVTTNADGEYNLLLIGTRKDIDAKNGFLGVEIWK